jgi:hypothetical protein
MATFRGQKSAVTCGNCGHRVSEQTDNYSWLAILIGPFLGIYLRDIVKFVVGFDIYGSVAATILAFLFLFLIVFLALYYLLPLSCNSNR